MGGRRFASISILLLAAFVAPVRAQPAGEIEMNPLPEAEPTPEPAPEVTPEPAPEVTPEPAPEVTPEAAPEPPPEAAPAPTEPPPVVKDKVLSRKLFRAGRKAMQKGDYFTRVKKLEEAKEHYEQAVNGFEKAIEVGDDLNYHFELATVYEKLGRFDLAAKHHRVLIKAESGVRPSVLRRATAKFDELAIKVGLVKFVVTPEGSTISLEGNVLGKTPLPEQMILMPGTYKFAFSFDGYQPLETEIRVEEGSESERTIELEEIKIIVEPVKPYVPPVETPKVIARPSKLPLYIGGGATVGLLAVATVTGILAVSQHGTYTAVDSTSDERDSARTSGKRLALVSDIALVGTLAAAGFTTYYYLFKYKQSQEPATKGRPAFDPEAVSSSGRPKVDLVPWVKHDAAGLVVGGSF